ncbi:tubby C-terminal domain-like protein [Tuberibacillus sp. Marseille-P3662]|uniref:tubby C-terminal domain-like protein n=1 Tax=Tuberibacillus sp. Marseille-P3662 TaxID=1965358 RepID=UPI000A1C9D4C|nr:hypothetical protein [Tuberibacillus sp. Marseille-P3662]
MNLYDYRFHNTYSTKPAHIYDENRNIIGTLTRVYSNPVQRLLDFYPFKGKLFVKYIITNGEDELVFISKKDLHIFKKRQYHISYYKDDDEYYVHLVDKKSFDMGEKTSFDFNGETYEFEDTLFDWARIQKDDVVIAEWKSSLRPPFKAYFKLVDEAYENEILFLMGIFHTYLHAV